MTAQLTMPQTPDQWTLAIVMAIAVYLILRR